MVSLSVVTEGVLHAGLYVRGLCVGWRSIGLETGRKPGSVGGRRKEEGSPSCCGYADTPWLRFARKVS